MCGICGVFDFDKERPVAPATVEAMTARLAHRGPDDSGIYVDRFVGLGHRRLSVIDLAGGRQPLGNEDGSVWVVYNGEIYNYLDLRRELADKGHCFATESDTEILVHAWEEHGEACVSQLNGMFAFALWDRKREALVLARDRLGIKPLYYTVAGRMLVFASEIKSILLHPAVKARVDVGAIPEYLLCTTLLDSKTMFQGIRSVPPGTALVVEDGILRRHRYWSLERDAFHHRGDSFEDCRERVRGLLDTSVRMQMVSDVPLGTLLSGGLDSSLVTAMANRHAGGRLRTFSMDYDGSKAVRSDRTDPEYAGLVAAAYRTDHTELTFRPEEYFEVLQRVTWHVEKPVDLTSPSLYLLYRGVTPKATVVMSGEGADELFAGYYFFLDRYSGRRPAEFPWAPYFEEVSSLLDPELDRTTGYRERIRATLAEDLAQLDVEDELNKVLYLFVKHYLVEMLERLDKTSMAWGVESRVPFLDHRLVEFVLTMPSHYKAGPGEEKRLLKSLAAHLLPEDVVRRRKRPVPTPVDPKTLFNERKRANERVQSPSGIGRYFDRKRVDDFLKKRGDYAGVDDLAIYRTSHALIALDAWHSTFGVDA